MNMQLVDNNTKIGLIVIEPSALPVDLNPDKLKDGQDQGPSGPSISMKDHKVASLVGQ